MKEALPTPFEQQMIDILLLVPPFVDYYMGKPESELITLYGQTTLAQIRDDRTKVENVLTKFFAIEHPEDLPGSEWVRLAQTLQNFSEIAQQQQEENLMIKLILQASNLLNTYMENQGGMVVGIIPRLVQYLLSGRIPGLLFIDHPVLSTFDIEYDPEYLGWAWRVNEALDELGYGQLYESEAVYFWRLYCRRQGNLKAQPPRNKATIQKLLAPLVAECFEAYQANPVDTEQDLIRQAIEGFSAQERLFNAEPLMPRMLILSMQLEGQPEIQISAKTNKSIRDVLETAQQARLTLLERADLPPTVVNLQDSAILPLLNDYFEGFRHQMDKSLQVQIIQQIATYLLDHFTMSENLAYGLTERLRYCLVTPGTVYDIRFTSQDFLPPNPPNEHELNRVLRALQHWKGDPGLADAFFFWTVVSQEEESNWLPVPESIREIQERVRPYILTPG